MGKPKGDLSRLRKLEPIKYNGLEIFTNPDADYQDNYKKNQGVLKSTRHGELCSQHLRNGNPSNQDSSHDSKIYNNNETVSKTGKNFDLISDKYFVNCNKNVCYKNNKSIKNVYWKDLDNSMYNLNKI